MRGKAPRTVRQMAKQMEEMALRIAALERDLALLTRKDRVDDALARIAALEQTA